MAFFSKKLTPTEARYHVTDREFTVIFKACVTVLSTVLFSMVSLAET